MTLENMLDGVTHLFLDTAPVIYFVEQNPQYLGLIEPVFSLVDEGQITAVTSPITLSECLVFPYRLNNTRLQADFSDLIVHGLHTRFTLIDEAIAQRAAQLRSVYHFSLADSLQIATALSQGCQAFLTNDKQLARATEIRVLVLADFAN